MLKHLSWIPWIMAILITGIVICLLLVLSRLFSPAPQTAVYPEAVLVMEDFAHALT